MGAGRGPAGTHAIVCVHKKTLVSTMPSRWLDQPTPPRLPSPAEHISYVHVAKHRQSTYPAIAAAAASRAVATPDAGTLQTHLLLHFHGTERHAVVPHPRPARSGLPATRAPPVVVRCDVGDSHSVHHQMGGRQQLEPQAGGEKWTAACCLQHPAQHHKPLGFGGAGGPRAPAGPGPHWGCQQRDAQAHRLNKCCAVPVRARGGGEGGATEVRWLPLWLPAAVRSTEAAGGSGSNLLGHPAAGLCVLREGSTSVE